MRAGRAARCGASADFLREQPITVLRFKKPCWADVNLGADDLIKLSTAGNRNSGLADRYFTAKIREWAAKVRIGNDGICNWQVHGEGKRLGRDITSVRVSGPGPTDHQATLVAQELAKLLNVAVAVIRIDGA